MSGSTCLGTQLSEHVAAQLGHDSVRRGTMSSRLPFTVRRCTPSGTITECFRLVTHYRVRLSRQSIPCEILESKSRRKSDGIDQD